jgi:hypothetical protein
MKGKGWGSAMNCINWGEESKTVLLMKRDQGSRHWKI